MERNMILNRGLNMNTIQATGTKKSWDEKTPVEKTLTIASILLSIAAFVFFILHMNGMWENKYYFLTFSIASLVSSSAYWNENRTVAKLELFAGISLLVTACMQ